MVAKKWSQEITYEDKLLFLENRKGLLASLRKQGMLTTIKADWTMRLLNSIEADIIKSNKEEKNASR